MKLGERQEQKENVSVFFLGNLSGKPSGSSGTAQVLLSVASHLKLHNYINNGLIKNTVAETVGRRRAEGKPCIKVPWRVMGACAHRKWWRIQKESYARHKILNSPASKGLSCCTQYCSADKNLNLWLITCTDIHHNLLHLLISCTEALFADPTGKALPNLPGVLCALSAPSCLLPLLGAPRSAAKPFWWLIGACHKPNHLQHLPTKGFRQLMRAQPRALHWSQTEQVISPRVRSQPMRSGCWPRSQGTPWISRYCLLQHLI